MYSVLGVRRMSSLLSLTPIRALAVTATIIAVMLFTPYITITNAQQPSPSSQPAVTQNSTSIFQSTQGSFTVQVPEGWVVRDVHNTGLRLLSEVLQGYGVLAQLCPEEQQQQQQAAPDAGERGNTLTNSSSRSSCQASPGGDIIHIIQYPNLGARLGFAPEDIVADSNNTLDNILLYEMQKLQEVGYRDMRVVNSTYTTVNLDLSKATAAINGNDGGDDNDDNNSNNDNNTITSARVPAKLVEMTYSTNSAPNETRTGYFMLTATNATPRNLGDITGYSLFYEGDPTAPAAGGRETATTPSSSLPQTIVASSSPPPAAVVQVFDSFKLIAGGETVQEILDALAAQAEQAEQPAQPAQQQEPPSALRGELISSDTTGVAPATFEFEANIEGGVEPYTINWDFDDGSGEDDEDSVVHTFDEAGTYAVTASVTDSVGQTASAGIEITVEEPSPAEQAEEIICDSSNTVLCNPPSSESENNQPDSDEPTNNSDEILDLLDSRLGTNTNPAQP